MRKINDFVALAKSQPRTILRLKCDKSHDADTFYQDFVPRRDGARGTIAHRGNDTNINRCINMGVPVCGHVIERLNCGATKEFQDCHDF